MIVFDTARRDAFAPYGASKQASPTVAQLASSGTAHPSAYSTGCWTVPAHGSMFTGLLPRSAGLGHAGMNQFKDFPAALEAHRDRLLPAVLGRNGYETAGISANAWVSERTGFSTGFDRFTFLPGTRSSGIGGNWRERAAWYLQTLRARHDDGARRVELLLDEWLGNRSRQPFFWFVNLMECHSPYMPPRTDNGLGPISRLRAGREASRHLDVDNIWRCCCGGFDVPTHAIGRMRRLYADSISQLDGWLARVLELLERHGVLDQTQVMVTADHGENLGEQRLLGHAFSLDNRLLRVPLVTAGPSRLNVEGPTSLAAVPRLLAELAGLDEHPWEAGEAPRDVVVAQFDAPGQGNDDRVTKLVSDWGLGAEAVRTLSTSFTCATDGRLKLFRRAGVEEIINLDEDPDESNPVPLTAAEETRHRGQLTGLRQALDQAEAAEHGSPQSLPTIPNPDADESARLEEQMRLLGYM